jgi:hypothetical protein
MPWYKFTARHGPGHQSHDESYQFFVEPIKTKADREYHWEDWVQRNYWDDSVGGIRLVRKLPEAVRLVKLAFAKRNVEYNQMLVKMLEK